MTDRPALLRLVGPESAAEPLLVALTAELRRRGYRVGAAATRPASLGIPAATVLTIGSGARVTIEGTPPLATVAARAAAIDPQLDLLLALADGTPGVPAIGVITVSGAALAIDAADLLASLPALEATRPREAGGLPGTAAAPALADLVTDRLLGPPSEVERTATAPIDTPRHLLSPLRTDPLPATEAPRSRSLLTRLRAFLGR